jgi:hypothetical protein
MLDPTRFMTEVFAMWTETDPALRRAAMITLPLAEPGNWASLPGNGRQHAPGGYSTGPISAPASSA